MIKNGFIINPYYELLPDYKISPFSTADISKNRKLPQSEDIDNYFCHRFGHERFFYTMNGRQSINLALTHYNLKPDDCVTIFTTTGNLYISSCVTNEIEKICKWSRKIEPNTKVIFVNHEFGFPYENIDQLNEYKLPIIEDCAHSFFSKDERSLIGRIGDFVIYSFPKMFPIQVGGLLVSNKNVRFDGAVDLSLLVYIKSVLSNFIKESDRIKENRKRNFNYLSNILLELNLSPRFKLSMCVTPGVYMFSTDKLDLPKLKEFMYKHGIQCSVFYGERSFYVPVHQKLSLIDLDYFKEVIKAFTKKGTFSA